MPDQKALLAAVTRVLRDRVANRGGGSPTWWPLVAVVMTRITGDRWSDESARSKYKRLSKSLKRNQDALDKLADSVPEDTYMPVVEEILSGSSGEETAVTKPDVEAKEWAPPPSRAENPDERIQDRKANLLRDHDRKVAKDLVNQAAITDLLVDAVTEGAKHAPPVIWRPAPEVLIRSDAVEEIPVALFGDIHVGTHVDAEEMGGLSEYNFEILKRRLDNYQTRIAQTIDLHRKDAKIRRMLVYFLGDMIEGEVIFDGQAFHIELISVDQLFEGAAYIMGWLQGLLATGLIEHIHCACIYGNHGRTTHKKGASKAHSNWDYVMYKHMEAVLKHETRISWFIPKAWFCIVDVMGWRIYGTHGDVIKSWMGIPFYGIQRHDMRTTTLLQSVGLDYRYWVCGDKHISATIPRVTGAQIMNGSIVGGSDFSMHILGTASEPMQTMFGINEKCGKTWQYDYVLDRRDPEEIKKHLAITSI